MIQSLQVYIFVFSLISSPVSFLRKAVEEATDPALACVAAYVSQDCTGKENTTEVQLVLLWKD